MRLILKRWHMKRVILILALIGSFSFFAGAQIQQGLRNSNYGGINSLQVNPSSFHHSPLKWDLNIASGGLFFENDYFYIENTNFISLIGHDGPFLFRSTNPESTNQNDPQALYYNFFDANSDLNNTLNAFAGLPSLAFRIDKFSFGIFANVRTSMGLNNLDQDLDYFSLDRWIEGEEKTIDQIQIAGMQWAEIGLNAALKIKDTEFDKWYGGLNLKYLRGFDGFYLNSTNSSTATEINDTLTFSGGPYKYGIASATLNDGNVFEGNGNGAGIDIGFTFIKKYINKSRPYLWRLGVSISDLGLVHFNQNTQNHQLEFSDLYSADKSNIIDAGSPSDLLRIASQETTGDESQTFVGDNFTLFTPAMISLQFDYSMSKNVFIGGQVNRRLNLSKKMVDRENLIATSIRFEKRNWEIGMPLSLFEDSHFRAGFWARIYFLTIGTDHIKSLVYDDPQFTGTDIYFAIKLNPFNSKGKSSLEDCNFN